MRRRAIIENKLTGVVLVEYRPQYRTVAYLGERFYLRFPYLQFAVSYHITADGYLPACLAVGYSTAPVVDLTSPVFSDFLPNQQGYYICLGDEADTLNHYQDQRKLADDMIGIFWGTAFEEGRELFVQWEEHGSPSRWVSGQLQTLVLLSGLIPADLANVRLEFEEVRP